MCEVDRKRRRDVLKLLGAVGFGALAEQSLAGPGVGAMMPGKGWMKAPAASCEGDGTPLQFIPKGKPDENPLESELEKYTTCPYCGMNRTQWHHSRHLVQFDDGLVDGTCSIHCLAISLSLNIDRGPKAIYAADFGSSAELKPLVNVDQATYLIGAELKGTMTGKSKMAFASTESAAAMQQLKGGQLGSFDDALREAYLGMAHDTSMVRKRRAERVKRMMKKQMQHQG